MNNPNVVVDNDNSDLDAVITEVRKELKITFFKRRDLIIKLGKTFENIGPKEIICAEIKNALREEIAQGLISRRDIDRHCPDEWKKKTKPKKEEKDKLSFSRHEQETSPQLLVDTDGNAVIEPATISASDSTNDVTNHDRSVWEETKDNICNNLENVKKSTSLISADQHLSEQSKVRELEIKIEKLQLEVKSKSTENSELSTEVEDLKSKLKPSNQNEVNQNKVRFFDVRFQVSFEDLRRHMNSSYKKNIGVAEVIFTARADLAKRELTEIQIVDAESLQSNN
jgi:hypothetical protein